MLIHDSNACAESVTEDGDGCSRPSPCSFISLWACAAIALLLAGCSGPLVRNAPLADAPADFPGHTAEQVLYQLRNHAPTVGSFRSEGRLEIDSPRISQGVGLSIRASTTDSLYAKLRGPLSIEVARALVTSDSLFAHDRLNHTFYFGALNVAERYVAGAGEPGLLARTLLGMVGPTSAEGLSISVNELYYVLTVADEQGRVREVWKVDPALWRIVRMEERAPNGTVLSRRGFSAFDRVDGQVLPRRVVLESPGRQITITIEHQNLTLNPADLTYPFTRPQDVDVVLLE